jgi:hypothetical protein
MSYLTYALYVSTGSAFKLIARLLDPVAVDTIVTIQNLTFLTTVS